MTQTKNATMERLSMIFNLAVLHNLRATRYMVEGDFKAACQQHMAAAELYMKISQEKHVLAFNEFGVDFSDRAIECWVSIAKAQASLCQVEMAKREFKNTKPLIIAKAAKLASQLYFTAFQASDTFELQHVKYQLLPPPSRITLRHYGELMTSMANAEAGSHFSVIDENYVTGSVGKAIGYLRVAQAILRELAAQAKDMQPTTRTLHASLVEDVEQKYKLAQQNLKAVPLEPIPAVLDPIECVKLPTPQRLAENINADFAGKLLFSETLPKAVTELEAAYRTEVANLLKRIEGETTAAEAEGAALLERHELPQRIYEHQAMNVVVMLPKLIQDKIERVHRKRGLERLTERTKLIDGELATIDYFSREAEKWVSKEQRLEASQCEIYKAKWVRAPSAQINQDLMAKFKGIATLRQQIGLKHQRTVQQARDEATTAGFHLIAKEIPELVRLIPAAPLAREATSPAAAAYLMPLKSELD
jgi:hypothetical protein